MEITWIQAIIFGIFACLASMPGMGGTVIGNYTLGRPLVAGLVVGIVLGDIKTGIIVGAAIQIVYIALVTPGGTVSADVRAISYIGIPLSIVAIKVYGFPPNSKQAIDLATTLGAAVGTLGTVLFYGTATINLLWQHLGWKAVKSGDLKKLYIVDMVLPWISHFICSFLPTLIITKTGEQMIELMKAYMPMDGIAMKTLFTVGSLLPAVGIAILLKQVINKYFDFLTFFFGFTLSACLGLNLIAASIIGGFFSVFNYKIKMLSLEKRSIQTTNNTLDDEEEDI